MQLPEDDIASLRGIASEEEPIVNALIDVFLASKSAEGVESYFARGRRLRDLNDTELAKKFADAVRAWAANLLGDNLLIIDVNAEYELRGSQPPGLDTVPEFATIKIAVQRAVEQMSEEQMNEIAAEVRTESEKVKKGRH